MLTASQAKQLLATQPSCTGAAIKALQEIALTHPETNSDLAAAYYVRAQREDRPADLLNALDSVNEAPRSAETLFNRALIQEALGLRDAAIASWDEFLKVDRSPWAAEARAHRNALAQRVDGVAQWTRNKTELGSALRTLDRQAVARLIAPFPSTAMQYFETLAPSGSEAEAMLATELARITKDSYPRDLMQSPAKRTFFRAQRADRAFDTQKAAEDYGRAAQMLGRKSALALTARLNQAAQISFSSGERALTLARSDSRIHAVTGLHPNGASKLAEEREALGVLLASGNYVGVGEIGLDFYRDRATPQEQYEALRYQLELARECSLPIVVHSRNADAECFAELSDWANRVGRYLGPDREVGQLHCFSGDAGLAAAYVELGFLISIPGTVTYKNNDRGQEVARTVPLAKMLVETDAPFLAPTPHRGKRNEPAYVVETARFVAAQRGCDIAEVATATAHNAARLFGFTL